MAASWEVAASRFTRAECISFMSTHSLLASGVDLDAILPSEVRLRGVLNYAWYNEGNFDPNIAAGTEYDWATFKYVRGGLHQFGTNAKQWDVWAWCQAQYNNNPEAFLLLVFSTNRIESLIADITPASSVSEVANKFYAAADKVLRVSGDPLATDRVVYPIGKWSSGNPSSGSVDTSVVAPGADTVRIKMHRANWEELFVGRPVMFGPLWDAKKVAVTSATVYLTTKTIIVTTDPAGFANLSAGDRINITGCNEGVYNRSIRVDSVISDLAIVVDIDGQGGVAAAVNSGWLISSHRTQTLRCTTAVPVAGDSTNTLIDCTFDESFYNGAPYHEQYVTVAGFNAGNRTIEALADAIEAMPEGSRMLRVNSLLSLSNEASHKIRYHDFAGGGDKAMSFDFHSDVLTKFWETTLADLKAVLDLRDVTLEFCYFDWEGIAAWFFMNTTGCQDQIIENDGDASLVTKWGFPTANIQTVGNQGTGDTGTTMTDKEMQYSFINAQLGDIGGKYIESMAQIIKDTFGDQVVLGNFRLGSLDASQTKPSKQNTSHGNPFNPHKYDNVRPDSLARWRWDISTVTDGGLLDLSADPPAYLAHPAQLGTVDQVGFGIVENGWQFMQTGNRQFNQPIFPTVYSLSDTTYHPGVANTRWVVDQFIHLFLSSDLDIFAYYNKRSTDDKEMEDLLLELEQVFPTGSRVPTIIEDVSETNIWGNAYVRSVTDNSGRLVYYFTDSPDSVNTYTKVGRDIHVDCPSPFEAQSTVIKDADFIIPNGQVSSGTWIESTPVATPSWCEYIRGIIATAIEERRQAGGYIDNNFRVDETYYPAARAEDATEDAIVYVIGLAADDDQVARSQTYSTRQPIQISVQKKLTSSESFTEANTYVKLEKQLRATAAEAVRGNGRVTHHGNTALRDASGSVLVYQAIRELGVFEAHFAAHYQYVAEMGEDPPAI